MYYILYNIFYKRDLDYKTSCNNYLIKRNNGNFRILYIIFILKSYVIKAASF